MKECSKEGEEMRQYMVRSWNLKKKSIKRNFRKILIIINFIKYEKSNTSTNFDRFVDFALVFI